MNINEVIHSGNPYFNPIKSISTQLGEIEWRFPFFKATMQRLLAVTIVVTMMIGITGKFAFADPPLTFTQMPICGDQDGSESPVVVRCPSFIQSTDVQIYQVPTTGLVDLRFDFVYRGANYNNELGFYKVENATGTINGLNPGDPGYLTAAMDNATIIFHSGSDASTPDVTLRLNAGELLAFFIIQNDTLDNFRANNPNNEITKHPLAFFALDRLNPDNQLDHFVGFRNTTTNYTQFGFEDLTNGGDKDYDDIVYNITPPLQPLTGQVDLKPLSTCLQQGQSHTLTAAVNSMDGTPLSGVAVNFTVAGANNLTNSAITDNAGKATFSYTGSNVGEDVIVVSATINGQTVASNNAFADWTATPCNLPAFTGTISPVYPTSHLTPSKVMQGGIAYRYFRLLDARGIPLANATVAFSVGTATTNAEGYFTYVFDAQKNIASYPINIQSVTTSGRG